MTPASTTGALAELLHTMAAVWLLLGPVLMTFGLSYPRGRSPLWTLASLAGGVGAFGAVRSAVVGHELELDPAVWAGLPLAAGMAVSLGVAIAVGRLPPTTAGRRWRGHLLEGEIGEAGAGATPCTLAVGRRGIVLSSAGETVLIAKAELLAIEPDASVVRLRFRAAGDAARERSARFLPRPADDGADGPALAAAIVARARRVIAFPLEQPGYERV